MAEPILVAKSSESLHLLPQYANRHGLIAGATGTGKTVTLQRLAEGFSQIGVPVFMADVKGDLAGISQPGKNEGKVKERLAALGLEEASRSKRRRSCSGMHSASRAIPCARRFPSWDRCSSRACST